eukprot:m.164976 g.164976  ORF g.164976 m.164976 type:complete len:71 (+) comp13431_c1_seq1:103-315(+)
MGKALLESSGCVHVSFERFLQAPLQLWGLYSISLDPFPLFIHPRCMLKQTNNNPANKTFERKKGVATLKK